MEWDHFSFVRIDLFLELKNDLDLRLIGEFIGWQLRISKGFF